jgi:signal transduction histidine kinase
MKNLGCLRLGGNLPEEIAVAGRALQNGWQPKYRVIVHGEMRDLQPMVRDDVYRMGREAPSNAFRHSRATETEADFCYERSEIRVYVRDDGCGISATALSNRNRVSAEFKKCIERQRGLEPL